MAAHPRPTSSVYSAFWLEDILEQINETQERFRSSDGNDPVESLAGSAWEDAVAARRTTRPECELMQSLEQQLTEQNAELQEILNIVRNRFTRLYNAMNTVMNVSRQLHALYLRVAHEKRLEQKREIASREFI